MYVAVDSAKQEVKRIDFKTKKGKARLRRYFEVDQAAYESKLDMKKIYEKFDFLSTTTNFITEKNSDFYIGRE